MNIMFISNRLGRSCCLTFSGRGLVISGLFALLTVPLLTLYGGYRLGIEEAENSNVLAVRYQEQLDHQLSSVTEAKRHAEENLNALSLRLGQMQAHVMRLDALGQRITHMAGLDKGEFDFANPPAQGGPENASPVANNTVPDFIAQLESLSTQLADREQQLSVLESMISNRNLDKEVFPSGRPVNRGWLSSHFGMRADPFTGKPDHHEGVDFAGKEGSDVVAVGSGVVTWAGKRYGYGNLVEINHGKGYVTRYGHNKELLVKVGDTVKKGQTLAKMGSTGRSTGPHVHFEVLLNGRAVNPNKYIQASR